MVAVGKFTWAAADLGVRSQRPTAATRRRIRVDGLEVRSKGERPFGIRKAVGVQEAATVRVRDVAITEHLAVRRHIRLAQAGVVARLDVGCRTLQVERLRLRVEREAHARRLRYTRFC